ncbi:MAG: hypothetical protein CVV42_07030 [Candidatus Riflebacteria bacterium HGW-Riflebacteria-2]|jgi:hypothetical protein|nr:MAG: hypothetical protein CVV42_07030 [Candidatus Riflebacteria bacterium HGW-Riflebacteria-2]
MRYKLRQLTKPIAAFQVSLLVLWVVFYPLHLWLELSPDKQVSGTVIAFERHYECCSGCSSALAETSNDCNYRPQHVRAACSICDFAAQLSASDMPLECLLHHAKVSCAAAFAPVFLVAFARAVFYDSRAPPAQLFL